MAADADERARIIDAAHRCLLGRPGSTVSVTEILAGAGLSTRAFYRHFESKDSLLLAMFRQDSERLRQAMDAAVAGAASPADALGRFIRGTLRLATEDRHRELIMIMMSEETRRARGYAAERTRVRALQEEAIAGILRQGRADGSFPWASPEADARSIRAALGQAFTDQLSPNAPATAEQAAARIIDFALRALGAATPDGAVPASRPAS